MSSLNDKANALRELAARLDRIDSEIQQLLSDAPSVVVAVELPPIKHFDFIMPRSFAKTIIEPKVPALAFGQVIYFPGDPIGKQQARFITRAVDTQQNPVRVIDANGETTNHFRSLESLAKDVSIMPSKKMYSVHPRFDGNTSTMPPLDFGQPLCLASSREPRFITRSKNGRVEVLDQTGKCVSDFGTLADLEAHVRSGYYVR